MGDNVYLKGFIAIVVVGLLVLGAWLLNQYKEQITISKFSSSQRKTKSKNEYSRFVQSSVVSNIGGRNFLKLEMAIPYEDIEQRRDLKRKMKRIKDDLLVNIEQKKMEEWVKQRDFAAIRNEYLKIINQHTDKPIENVYFKTFNIY